MPKRSVVLEIEGREVAITNPDKVFFPKTGHTKLDLVNYYLAVADGALRGVDGRPMALKRFVNGADGEPFFQKRAPDSRPEWIETVELSYPSGRTADEIVVRDAAQLIWVVNLGCIDLNPHPVRAEDLDHPDELRVDLDPIRGVAWPQVREVALVVRDVLADFGLRRLAQDVRLARLPHLLSDRAALDVSRGAAGRAGAGARGRAARAGPGHQQVVEGRTPRRVRRLQPERQRPHDGLGVLGAADAPTRACRRRCEWDEVPTATRRVHDRHGARRGTRGLGDPGEGIDAAVGSLEALLELAARQAGALMTRLSRRVRAWCPRRRPARTSDRPAAAAPPRR